MLEKLKKVFGLLGPGMLLAATAIGVSHLVQSTRAGAKLGVWALLLIVIANVIKYPSFLSASYYTTITGNSLLTEYRKHRFGVPIFSLVTLLTMVPLQSAVLLVTTGLLMNLLGLQGSIAVGVLVVNLALIAFLDWSRFSGFQRAMTLIVLILTFATLMATCFLVPEILAMNVQQEFALPEWSPILVAGLMGWMPTSNDIGVWTSLWTQEAWEEEPESIQSKKVERSWIDFHVGYVVTAFLALCFGVLGWVLLRDVELASSAPAFASQLIEMYGDVLGSWAKPLLSLAAVLVMVSTSLTVVEAYPRVWSAVFDRGSDSKGFRGAIYGLQALGCFILVLEFQNQFREVVDLATVLSFTTGPLLAYFHHKALFGNDIPEDFQLGSNYYILSLLGLIAQSLFALWFLWIRFAG